MNALLIANWKMHYGPIKAGGWVRAFRRERLPKDVDIAVAVPHVSLAAARASLGRASIPSLAAQDVFWDKDGSFTGEVSASMLDEFGVQYCLVGHSERRTYLNETSEMVAKKAAALQEAGIVPVICVGETAAEYKKKETNKILRQQTTAAIAKLNPDSKTAFVFAYEPIWAIGSGKPCPSQRAREAHEVIRGVIAKKMGETVAAKVRILYGGSVDSNNITEYITTTGIDGALVGGASLDPRVFGLLCRTAVPS
ncbi:MAG: triose-phosphate isomerase [Patescibacteria group bacterium]|nr:triose-phosphate isomerase [Patescibacteria group bacterium]